MLWLVLFCVSVFAAEEPYRMNDLGGDVYLPSGFQSTEWADWSLKAKSKDGVHLKIWTSPYQVEVTEDAAEAWSKRIAEGLVKEGLDGVRPEKTLVETISGRATAVTDFSFKIKPRGTGVALARTFTAQGQVVHVRLVTAKKGAKKAAKHLDFILEKVKMDGPPHNTAGSQVSTDAGFGATLPAGWRQPVEGEFDLVRKISAQVNQEALAPEQCWVAIQPPLEEDPDLIFACSVPLYLGPVDAHSFAGEEAILHERYFPRVDVPVAEEVTIGDRMGFYYRAKGGSRPVRLALAPYGGGMVMELWGLSGGAMSAEQLDAALMELLPSVTFSGADGGQPVIGADKWVGYVLRYRLFSPLVLLPLLFLLGAGVLVVVLIRRSRGNRWDDDDL